MGAINPFAIVCHSILTISQKPCSPTFVYIVTAWRNATLRKSALFLCNICHNLNNLGKVKVSHSLIAVGGVGVRVPLYLGHSWWKAEPIPLLSLSYPSLIRKRYPFSAGLTDRVFQSMQCAAEPRTHAIRRLSAALTTRPRRLSNFLVVLT